MSNKIDMEEVDFILDKITSDHNYLDGFDFSILMQDLLISKYGSVIDTGNWKNVNAACAEMLVKRIKKHPLLWKLFFMVA